MDSVILQMQPVFLTVCRLSPLFSSFSFLPFSKFPMIIRLVLLLVLSIGLTSITIETWTPMEQSSWYLSLGFEWILGMLMVVGFQLAYASILMVGRVLDLQIGFAAAGVIDPASNNNDPLLGTILTLFFSVAFLLTNTHLDAIAVLVEVFRLIPPGSWDGSVDIAALLSFFATQLALGFILLGPIVMGLWLLDVFNGIIAKTMPQMNVYFVMLPLKIAVGLFLLSVSMQQVKPIIQQMFSATLVWLKLGWIN